MSKKYQVIYADPPWAYDNASVSGAAANHYDTCEVHEDKEFKAKVDKWADENCALFMWGTWPKLREAFLLGDEWGFRYVTCAFEWVKTNLDPEQNHMFQPTTLERLTVFGTGFYSAGNTEFCLLWKRGSISKAWADNTIRQLVFDQRREHSRKPDKVRKLIERAYPNANRMEMFSRRPACDNWDVWGNETDKFESGQA